MTTTPGDSWKPVDLAPYLDGTYQPPQTGLAYRDDKQGLLYPGEVHFVVGESGAGKGWLLNHFAAQVIEHGSSVLFLDFEDSAGSVVSRLMAAGVGPATIENNFGYIRPTEPVDSEEAAANLSNAVEAIEPALVIVDGVTEAMTEEGLNPNANDDAATWLAQLARPLADTGAAVVLVDHVTKTPQDRNRFAIGAQHKRAGSAVTYTVETKRPIEKGRDDGLVQLWVAKDRHGTVQASADGPTMPKLVAEFHVAANHDGTDVSARLTAPAPPKPFRPTVLMERISRHLEQYPGASWNQIRSQVTGNNDGKRTALAVLIDDGHVFVEIDGQTHRHHSKTPYRTEQDEGDHQ